MNEQKTTPVANEDVNRQLQMQLLKEWNIDHFFSRDDEKRHSTQSAVAAPVTKSSSSSAHLLERQVHREIISPRPKVQPAAVAASNKRSSAAAPVAPVAATEGNFMKNFSFIKNFKREKSDLFPLSKRHSSEISYNVNVSKYMGGSAAAPQRISVIDSSGCRVAGADGGMATRKTPEPVASSLLRAGPRREKTESVILRRNSTQVAAKHLEGAAAVISRPVTAADGQSSINHTNTNQIDLKSTVAGEGGSRLLYGDQVILPLPLYYCPGVRRSPPAFIHYFGGDRMHLGSIVGILYDLNCVLFICSVFAILRQFCG